MISWRTPKQNSQPEIKWTRAAVIFNTKHLSCVKYMMYGRSKDWREWKGEGVIDSDGELKIILDIQPR